MKKSTFPALAAVAALLLLSLSCQKHSSISNKEKNINLDAPSGQRIASTIQQLKEDAVQVIVSKHAGLQAFEITGIDFLPVKKGYAAIVSYRLQDGTAGSYGIFSGVRYRLAQPHQLSVMANYQDESMAVDGKISITCEGTCNCKMSTTINTDTGVITVDCGCNNCSAQVKQS
jgi:hypothetical protein